jgi:acyl-coenzyme A synthetase/AMP-(fatty) acid ligase
MSLTLILVLAGVFIFGLLIVGIVVSLRPARTEVDERIDKYVEEEKPPVPDAKRGETVKAFIVLKPGFAGKVTEQEIKAR